MDKSSNHFENLFLAKDASGVQPPVNHDNFYLINGELKVWNGERATTYTPVYVQGNGENKTVMGTYPMQTEKEALEAVDAAQKAYDSGKGVWPTMTPKQRIEHVERYLEGLKKKRDTIVNLLMWEICKTKEDAQKEVDRTILYIQDTIRELKTLTNHESTFKSNGGFIAQIRRAPLGVVLCLGPFNYPFNETYTLVIPALIMGNPVVMKLPRVGVLCHMPTLELFQSIFPPGVVNVISGSGRRTLPPIMKSGKIDVFSFIGTSDAADDLHKAHPKPHRLHVCLGLEAKNPGIVLPCADLKTAVSECALGAFSYNGQRCTAIKIVLVHESIAEEFVSMFSSAVDALKMGLPWEEGVKITPLPEEHKPGYLEELIQDAVSKGAKVVNNRGGKIDRSFVAPTILYPVNKEMRVYHEEQFGPVTPIAVYKNIEDIFAYMAQSNYGQQASIFGKDTTQISALIDVLVNQVSRVNINTQCQRGPDVFPFTARKDSAYGTLSVYDALRVFSIRSLVATKETPTNEKLVSEIVEKRSSNFLRMEYLF